MDGHCSRCPGHPKLEATRLKGVALHLCKSCRGILMAREDVEAVLAMVGWRGQESDPEGAPGYFDRLRGAAHFLNKEISLRCPACRYNMYEVQAGDLLIDFCLNCQALWFDEGELKTALREARELGTVHLVPADISENGTIALVGWMLQSLPEPK
jgi:Zn-finger nucleic acid-binding protein